MSDTFIATYRLQLGPELDFAGARALVPYLAELGISHLYLSPVLQAAEGSTHGYDVADPRRISEQLGGEKGLRALCAAGLGVVIDVVPNHMAADDGTPFWSDQRLRERFFDLNPDGGGHRRFFDIDDLAGVRVEDPIVFATTHGALLELVSDGLVAGLRVDHPDGLVDPAGYLERLAGAGVEHVWVEKILEPGEALRDWPVEGTTGYDFMNEAQGLFVDPAGQPALDALQLELTGDARPFRELAAEAKRQQAATTFTPEVQRLQGLAQEPAAGIDIPAALAGLPVYRTYVEPWSGTVEDADREALTGLPEPLRRVLLLEERGHDEFVARFQQTTGAVMAKGVEDTAFYRYTRLLALNEVGGDPGRFGISIDQMHAANAERAERFPRSLLALQTHDTKRGADVRARIGALSGMGEEWAATVRRWRGLNAPLRRRGAPDGSEEHLIYQTLVGAWPLPVERLLAYLEKALREEKTHTAWVDGDEDWEAAVADFARGLYGHRPFLEELERVVERVRPIGENSALGQLLLSMTSPGVPDVYQGEELWTGSLVDPDNRRPVDWDERRRLLGELRAGAAPSHETRRMHLLQRALALRARRPEAFAGAYLPLPAGERAIAYARGGGVIAVTAVRPGPPDGELELPAALTGGWRDALGDRDLELGSRTPLAQLLGDPPLALLERPE